MIGPADKADQSGCEAGSHIGKKGKVLFVVSSAPLFDGDASSPFILNMAQDLCDLGWQVDILAPHAPGALREEIIGDVRVFRFRYCWPGGLQTLCYRGGIASNLRCNSLNYLLIPLFLFSEYLAIRSRIKNGDYQLIHSHWLIPQSVLVEAMCNKSAPHIMSVHGGDIFSFNHKLIKRLKKWVLRRVDGIIANSTATVRAVKNIFEPGNMVMLPTGAKRVMPDPQLCHSLHEKYKVPGEKLVIFVGRLVEEKGVEYLLRAIAQLRNEYKLRVLIVGEGPIRNELELLVDELSLGAIVHFVGAVPHSEVASYLAIADVFVGPSISHDSGWVEAQGNTFIEALLCRVPVVASNIGGIPDAIVHEKTGLLVSEKSPEEIAAAIARILTDKLLANMLVDAGYTHAVTHFSRNTIATEITALYGTCLSSATNRIN